jgi:hypothetical protein
MRNKIAGIVCDNYKLEKFKKELVANGFADFEVTGASIKSDLSTIKVKCENEEIPQIGKICEEVESYFLAMKN